MISAEDYNNKILPSLADLGELYGISAPICMQIIRPKLNETLLVCLPSSGVLSVLISDVPPFPERCIDKGRARKSS